MSCLAALRRTIGRRSTETLSESLKSPDKETLSASVTRKHGAAGALTALDPASQQLGALEHVSSPCLAVFSLKPEGRFIISVIFRTDSSAHLCPQPLCRSARVQAASMAPGKIQGRGPIQGAPPARHPGQNGADW